MGNITIKEMKINYYMNLLSNIAIAICFLIPQKELLFIVIFAAILIINIVELTDSIIKEIRKSNGIVTYYISYVVHTKETYAKFEYRSRFILALMMVVICIIMLFFKESFHIAYLYGCIFILINTIVKKQLLSYQKKIKET